ncbi:DoxX family protein [Goodfellowiella coeruleoviolacea]|uniref:DoxX family protein n=1 Tax=Goodfellowiella coeruleoviolacea TaxID=334858 RepID=UPI0020A43C34|nr:DoxX family protein [Goodfellowiella coeruleoviolacea]
MATHDDRPRRSGGYRADGGHPGGAGAGGRDGGAHHLDEDRRYGTHDEARYDQPGYDQPGYDQAPHQRGRYEPPGHRGARYDDPRYEDPRYDDPRYDDVGYGEDIRETARFGDPHGDDPRAGEGRRGADDEDFFTHAGFSSSGPADEDRADSRQSTVDREGHRYHGDAGDRDDDRRDYDDPGDHRGYGDGYDGYYDDEPRPQRWHGGADLGLLVLRLVLGGTFVAHGAQKLFGLFNGPGIDGFSAYLAGIGFQRSTELAWVTGGTEFGAGILLVFGLFTPLAAAGVLGVMASAVVYKWGNGFFVSSMGFEYELALATMAFTLLFAGPGRVSLDNGRPWYRRPLISGTVFLVIAAAATVATLLVLRRTP